MIYLYIILILMSFNSFSNSCDNLYFYGFGIPHSEKPRIESEVDNLDLFSDSFLKEEETLYEIEKIIENKVYNSNYDVKRLSVFDYALFYGFSKDIMDTIFSLGYEPTKVGIGFNLHFKNDPEFLKLLHSYYKDGLNDFYLSKGEKEYSISNYLISKGDFDTLVSINELGIIDVNDNAFKKDLVDIRNFSLEDRLLLSNLFDLNLYLQYWSKKDTENKKAKELLKSKLYDYRYNILVSKCDIKEVDLNKAKFHFATPTSDLFKEISSHGGDLKELESFDIEKLSHKPLLQDLLIVINFKSKEGKKSKFIDSFNNLSRDEIASYINNNKFDYYSRDSFLSLFEYEYLGGRLNWDDSDYTKFSFDRVAAYLIDNRTHFNSFFKNKAIELKGKYYDGKNLSYYLMSFTYDTELVNLILKSDFKPSSKFGINILEYYWLKSRYDYNYLNAYEVVKKSGYYKNRLVLNIENN